MAVKVWVLDSADQLRIPGPPVCSCETISKPAHLCDPSLLPPYEWEIMSAFQGCCELEVKYAVAPYGLVLSQW